MQLWMDCITATREAGVGGDHSDMGDEYICIGLCYVYMVTINMLLRFSIFLNAKRLDL